VDVETARNKKQNHGSDEDEVIHRELLLQVSALIAFSIRQRELVR
jgi:hypothetical protein